MSKKLSKIEAKKLELEQDLLRLQEGMDQNLDHVKDDVVQSFHPVEVIKKHPLPVVGAAVVLGFLLGTNGTSTRSGKKESSKNVILRSIGDSLKKKLAKKATEVAIEYAEGILKGSNNKE